MQTLDALSDDEISPTRFRGDEWTVVDVRPPVQFRICQLPNCINVPLAELQPNCLPRDARNILFVCRRGVDSLAAVHKARAWGDAGGNRIFKSMRGGLNAYADQVDDSFPKY